MESDLNREEEKLAGLDTEKDNIKAQKVQRRLAKKAHWDQYLETVMHMYQNNLVLRALPTSS